MGTALLRLRNYFNRTHFMTEIVISKFQQKMLVIPDTMQSWPYDRAFNPNYDEAVAESRAWFSRYMHFTKQFDFYDDCCAFRISLLSIFSIAETSTGLICALMYPNVSKGMPNHP